jgi:hypothetical protein
MKTNRLTMPAAVSYVLFLLIFAVLEGFGWYFFFRDREDYFPKMLRKGPAGS